MGCPHTERCPLFPLLRASLRSWRDYYCDSADGWRGCARYELSLTGAVVPIVLLPNGAHAQHLRRAAADVDRAGPAQSTQPQWSGPDSWQTWAPAPPANFEGIRRPAQPVEPAPSAHVVQIPGNPPAGPPEKRRGWWTRFADWISGPA
jgi:hypothetical protein